MVPLVLLAFLVVPVVEIAVFARIASSIGFFDTLFLVVLVSAAGAWLVKREGVSTWQRLNQRLASGQVPTDELINGACILFAGALMLTPGFVTDLVALALLLPPSRAVVRRALRDRVANGVVVRGFPAGGFPTGGFGTRPGRGGPASTGGDDVWDVDGWEEPPDRRALP